MEAMLVLRGGHFNPNFFYKTKSDIDHAVYCEINGKKIIFAHEMNLAFAKKKTGIETLDIKFLAEFLEKKKIKKIKMDLENCPAGFYCKFQRKFRIEDNSSELKTQRAVKNAGETKKIKKACKKTMELIKNMDFNANMAEKKVASLLIAKTYSMGFEPAFEPIVANVKNARFPHYEPGNAKIGNVFLIDYGIKAEKYCSDISEMVFLKKEKTLYGKYETLKGIFYEITDNMQNFANAGELAKFAWRLYDKEKITKPPHAIGHGIGLQVHEFPWLNEKSKMKLENATIAVEPAVYTKSFGLRFERTLLVQKNRKALVF